ncbi:glycosyltransferase [Larkinella rosea]|uniref:Glycosyltransferase n=1 Tax=Larkinella rosea TaxID=2025312 RepID=A0A3P1C1J2_9BACT|nr:glycosyltransferase [Larkinella rosea]RRB07147.1 glycosyltransferase [Larkinella rosea]
MTIDASILIAARNEEDTILRCLQALERLNYPSDRYEVLIGNDQSEDKTGSLTADFIRNKPQYRLFTITEKAGKQAGKANVLAQLAQHARGQFLLFTDADCEVPPSWVCGMLKPFRQENIGILTGCTQIFGKSTFQKLQAVDWFYGQYLIKQFANLNIPITAMGNNMAVRRTAYDAVGGYENLPFSVVEDYQLFTEILQQRFSFSHLFKVDVLATTRPIPNWKDWLQQRKRWMVGAMQLPIYFVGLFLVQLFFYPLLIALAFGYPTLALTVWMLKFGIQTVQLLWILNRFRRWDLLPYVPGYEFFLHIGYFISLIYYLLPNKVVWKGRTYS